MKPENVPREVLRGMDRNLEVKDDRAYYLMNRIWTPKFGGYRDVVMNEGHKKKNTPFILAWTRCIWTSRSFIGGQT